MCSFWKSQGVSFSKAIEDLKLNFKIVDNVIPDKHVEIFIKYESKPEKVQSQSTNLVVYDLETFITVRDVIYSICNKNLSKISGTYNRDITQQEHEKCKKCSIVFKGTSCFNKMLDYVLKERR